MRVLGFHGLLLGLVYRAVRMLRGSVDRIDLQRFVALVDVRCPACLKRLNTTQEEFNEQIEVTYMWD